MRDIRSNSLKLLVGTTALVGAGVTIAGLAQLSTHNAVMLAALVIAAAGAEFFAVELFVDSHVSVSGAALMAAGAVFGLPGVVLCAPAIALAGQLRDRPEPYKTVFNVGALAAAGGAYVLVFHLLDGYATTTGYGSLMLPAIVAALANMAVNSALVAFAITLESDESALSVWRGNFLWLAPQYGVMGAVAIGVALAMVNFGTWSLAVFALPVVSLSEALHTRAEAMKMRQRALDTIVSVQDHKRAA